MGENTAAVRGILSSRDQQETRRSTEEWRNIVRIYRTPMTKIIHPLHVLLKSKLNCDVHGRILQERILNLGERNVEASNLLLDSLLAEEDREDVEILSRWQSFEQAVKDVHPVLHEIITGNCDVEIQEQQKGLIEFFTEDISRYVDPTHILPALYSNRLLGQVECERLRCICDQHGPTMGAIYMLSNIHRLSQDWYSVFLGVLIDNKYGELVKMLDEDTYEKKLQQRAQERPSPIGGNGKDEDETSVLDEWGPAHRPRPSNYSAAPLDNPVHQSGYHSDLNTEAKDDDESECFHSCDSSFDLEDDETAQKSLSSMTKAKLSVCGINDGAPGNTYIADDDSDNQELVHTRKEIGGKNILLSEENPDVADNSNVEVNDAEPGEVRQKQEEAECKPLVLRDYQEELALEGLAGNNVIVIAPTGSGKTLVALRLMQNHMQQPGPGVRKVVFLVNQLALAQQQFGECTKYLSNFRLKLVIGYGGAAATEKVPLKHQVMRADILVMTAQILLNALDQKEIEDICQFSMVVFDECHHTNLQHPFNSIMHHYMEVKYNNDGDDLRARLPQVVGLTASAGVGKAGNQEQAKKHVQKLCAHLDADFICTVRHNTEQLAQHSNDPTYDQRLCQKRPDDKFQAKIENIMKEIETKMELSQYLSDSDTDGLKEKLKQKPHVKGTSQYTGWVSELMRSIAMLEDPQARRFLESCRRMLKFYNESLVINDECDTEDALDFLDQQMMDIYDPLGKRFTDIDLFLKDLFDKNKPYLEAVSKEQANTNPKLNTLEELLTKAFRDEPESRAMVFVKTRDMATALQQWMLRRPQLKPLKAGKMVGAGPSADKGGMTKNQQIDVTEFFKVGDHKVMVATSVAEEGLDFRKCNIVIRYNYVTNEIAMVQARGRARAENSLFVTLASQESGVQAKEEVNFIRELMMREAIKELQVAMKTDHTRFRETLHEIQRDEKSKRDAERSLRSGRMLRQGDIVFNCRSCDAYAFMSSDVRKIENIHHVVIDLEYRQRHIERPSPPREFGQITVHGRLACRGCGEDWGSIILFQNSKFPGIKLEGFRLTDEFNRKDVPKKWRQVHCTIEQLKPDELEQYRQAANAVGYNHL